MKSVTLDAVKNIMRKQNRCNSKFILKQVFHKFTAVTAAVVFSGSVWSAGDAGAESGVVETPAEWNKRFESVWTQVKFNHTRNNPVLNQSGPLTRTRIFIAGKIRILDKEDILAISNQPVLLKAVDDDGKNVLDAFNDRLLQEPGRRYYSQLRINHDNVGRGKFIEGLASVTLNLELDTSRPGPGRFARIEGYLMAITADEYKHVDILFEPAGEWTEILPGQKVRFAKAEIGGDSIRYRFESHPENDQRDRFHGSVSEDQPLPERIVVEQLLVDASGKPVNRSFNGSFINIGSGSGSMAGKQIRTAEKPLHWRYCIALNPIVQKVPFVLTNIELPAIEAPSGLFSIAQEQAATQSPLIQMERALLKELTDRRENAERFHWTDEKDKIVREQWEEFKSAHNKGAGAKLEKQPIDGVVPSINKYDDYLGSYVSRNPDDPQQKEMEITVRKDDKGRFVVDSPEGPLPAAPHGGVLKIVFDDILIGMTDPLDLDAPPKLFTLTMASLDNQMVVLMNHQGQDIRYELQRVDEK